MVTVSFTITMMRISEFVIQKEKKVVKFTQAKALLTIFIVQIAIVIFSFQVIIIKFMGNLVFKVDMRFQLKQICKKIMIFITLLVKILNIVKFRDSKFMVWNL